MEMLPKRDSIYDVAKGISILIMTISHFDLFKDYPTIFQFNINVLMLFKMPLFIFISGILFSQKNSLKYFITHKFDALVKPIVTLFLLGYLLLLLFYLQKGADFSEKNLQAILIKLLGYYLPLWFPVNLFFSLVIYRFLKHSYEKYSPKLYIISIMSTLLVLVYFTQINFNYYLFRPNSWIFFIIILYIGQQFKNRRWVELLSSHAFFLFSLILFTILVYNKKLFGIDLDLFMNDFGKVIPTSLTFITGISIILYLSRLLSKIPMVSNVLEVCAQSSLFILAFHIFFANTLFTSYFREIISYQIVADTITFVLTIGLSVSLYFLLKKTRYIKYALYPIKTLQKTKGNS